MDKKFQIFISSTFKDLVEQRNEVVKVVLRLSHLPVGMEIFNAASATPWDVITSHIDNSDYYVLILAHRYGSEDPETGIGYTEKEYDYALSKGIPCLAFVLQDGVQWNPDWMEQKLGPKRKLAAFKKKIHVHHLSYWTSTEDLANKVLLALVDETRNKPGIGWVRANAVTSNPAVAEELSRLSRENSELKNQLAIAGNNTVDEIDELKKILYSANYSVTVNEKKQEFSLKDIFLGFCSVQGGSSTLNVLRALVGVDVSLSKDWYSEITPALKEIYLLGLTKYSGSDSYGPTWSLVEKGQKMYVRLHAAIDKRDS